MSGFRQKIKQAVHPSIWSVLSDWRYSLNRVWQLPAAAFHPLRQESKKRLASLKDVHKGERCFIIGNGPSLKNTDLQLLRNEHTFGMNRIYMMFPELGFSTSYLVSVNDLVIEQCSSDFQDLEIPTFLSWRSMKFIDEPRKDIVFLHTTYTGPKFALNAADRLWEGATVTYVTMQLAYHMGFSQVILIGVDHSFTTKGKPNTTITSEGDDPNHFNPNYFGKGFRWQLPDLDTSERGYLMARDAFQRDGREIIDATVGGKLDIFPKVDYVTLFD